MIYRAAAGILNVCPRTAGCNSLILNLRRNLTWEVSREENRDKKGVEDGVPDRSLVVQTYGRRTYFAVQIVAT